MSSWWPLVLNPQRSFLFFPLPSFNGIYFCIFLVISWNFILGFPGGSVVKNSPASAGDTEYEGLTPGSGRSTGERNRNLPQYSCLENSMERNLVGYSPWGRKGSDMTEQLTRAHTHAHTQQKPTQHCKAIFYQLINFKK